MAWVHRGASSLWWYLASQQASVAHGSSWLGRYLVHTDLSPVTYGLVAVTVTER